MTNRNEIREKALRDLQQYEVLMLDGHFDFPAYIGFTAGTGGDTNLHPLDGLTVTESSCD